MHAIQMQPQSNQTHIASFKLGDQLTIKDPVCPLVCCLMKNNVRCPTIPIYHQPITGYLTASRFLAAAIGTGQLRLICSHNSCSALVREKLLKNLVFIPSPPPPHAAAAGDKTRFFSDY